MRRRRNQWSARRGMANSRNVRSNFFGGKLATLTGIASAAELVHRESECAVCFGTERTKRHGLRAELFQNVFCRLDFFDGNRRRRYGFEQVAKEYDCAAVVGKLFEGGIFSRIGGFDVRMESANDFGRIGVEFGAFTKAVQSSVGHFFARFCEGFLVQTEIVAEKVVQRFLAGKVGGVFEKLRADFFRETNNFK